jgi:hypothetical protein
MSKSIAVFGAGPGLGRLSPVATRERVTPSRWWPPPEPLDRLAKDLTSAGATAHVITADLSDTGATPRLAEQIRAKAGDLDAFYYAPTPDTGFVSAADLTPQHAQKLHAADLLHDAGTRAGVPAAHARAGGRRHPDRAGRQHRAGPAEHERPQSRTSRPAQLPARPCTPRWPRKASTSACSTSVRPSRTVPSTPRWRRPRPRATRSGKCLSSTPNISPTCSGPCTARRDRQEAIYP